MVVRDSVDDVLMSAGTKKMTMMPALQAEAEATRFGLRYAFDAGLRSLDVESDCLTLVKQLQGKSRERTTTQILVNDILVLTNLFDYCSSGFASRKCNKVVAHSIAKVSLSFDEVKVWMEECPTDIVHHVLSDKALID